MLDWLISPLSSRTVTWPSVSSHSGSSAVGHTGVAPLRLLEDVIHAKRPLVPSLTDHASPGPEIRSLFGLPALLGGLRIHDEKGPEATLYILGCHQTSSRPTPLAGLRMTHKTAWRKLCRATWIKLQTKPQRTEERER